MLKLTKTQEQIVAAMEMLPEKLEPVELESLVCSLVSGYIGFEETAGFFLYMHLKVQAIHERLMEEAEEETKH
ncbi:MAG TPA: hypothetical protein VIG24_10770 [Acidimicrobiia bacterium]